MTSLPALPLTGQEWVAAIERIEALWPGTKTWTKNDLLFDLYRPYTAGIVSDAITALFNEGSQTAPSPSKLMATVRKVAGEKGIRISDNAPCEHPHPMHLAPSDLGSTPSYTGLKGPGRQECAGCRHDLGSCHCAEICRKDPRYAAKQETAA